MGGALLGCVKYISTQFQVKLVLCFVADAWENITACLSQDIIHVLQMNKYFVVI